MYPGSFIAELSQKGIGIINSAVFHSGFLTGGNFYDYRLCQRDNQQDSCLFDWRDNFFAVCRQYRISPATACVQFGLSPPGVGFISLNTSRPERVEQNVAAVLAEIPEQFGHACKETGLIDQDYPFAGS